MRTHEPSLPPTDVAVSGRSRPAGRHRQTTAPHHRDPQLMNDMYHRRRGIPTPVSLLGLLLLVAGGAVPAFAATASPTPKLPGEYFRKANQVTAAGTLFDNICVRINGDVARIYVPQSVKPYSSAPVPVVWFYHGSGSDHNALDGG